MLLVAAACAETAAAPSEILVGGPCQGCEAVFEGRPAKLASVARIAPATEPGEPLVVEGVVRRANGAAVPGVIVYAYHTDASGLYPSSPGARHRHGRLRGFAVTDREGRYVFRTIRPASYPRSNNPQHVHMHVLEPRRCHYTIDDLVFTDDPTLTAEMQRSHARGRGGIGIATPRRVGQTWTVRRDIVLGAGIPDYARCGS